MDLYLDQIRHLELYYFNIDYLGNKSKEGYYNNGCLTSEKYLYLNSSKDESLRKQQIWKMRELHSGF